MQSLGWHARRVGGLLHHTREATQRRGEHLGHGIITVHIHALEKLEQREGTVPHERHLDRGTKGDDLNGTSNGESLALKGYHTVPFAAGTLQRRGKHLFE